MLIKDKKRDITLVSLKNENKINAIIAEPIKEELLSMLKEPNTKLALNLEGVKFVDSSGFGVFLSVMKTANNNAGQFKICNVSKEVYELFKLLQLHTVFSLHDDLDSCLSDFQ